MSASIPDKPSQAEGDIGDDDITAHDVPDDVHDEDPEGEQQIAETPSFDE
jgi:hypothetical protein